MSSPVFGSGASSDFGGLKSFFGLNWEFGMIFLFGGGENFNFGWLRIILCFSWGFS